MSYILDALKRAEQKAWRGKTLEPRTVEPAFESPAWEVKMVSPSRFARFRAGEGGDAIEKGNGRLKGVGIVAGVLTLLLLIECAVIYEVRGRISVIASEVGKLTRQIGETEARLTKREGERLSLKRENDLLRKELEAASVDLARTRDAVRKLKVKEQRLTAGKRQARVRDQARSESYSPPKSERPSNRDSGASLWDMVETASVTTYSIR
jgi:hypothetical protein